ncbi:MAG TPA: VacJ family lipoprotein [Prosthecobacter sp.]
MKLSSILLRLVLPVAASAQLVSCATSKTKGSGTPTSPSTAAVQQAKPGTEAVDELDDYGSAAQVSDPLEGMNRVTFKINDGLYTFLLRPVSKGYVAVAPKPLRQGLDNFFDNVKFPVRFVNCTLQGKMKRAGQEVQKFGVNTFAGFGGLIRQSDKIPSLASVPAEDTGQTLGKWGLGNGPYLVLPVFGPSSMRDGVGMAGDYVLNPVNWGFFLKGSNDSWTWIPSTVNNVRSWPSQLELYDEARQNAVDPYISVRSVYIQNREAVVND